MKTISKRANLKRLIKRQGMTAQIMKKRKQTDKTLLIDNPYSSTKEIQIKRTNNERYTIQNAKRKISKLSF